MENFNSKNNDHLKFGGGIIIALTHMGLAWFTSILRNRAFVYNATIFIAVTSYKCFLPMVIQITLIKFKYSMIH